MLSLGGILGQCDRRFGAKALAMFAQALASRLDARFLLEDFEPAYMRSHRSGALNGRALEALAELADCHACPRNCRVDRLQGETRVCHTGRHAVVSSAFPHFGEEDCLRGWNGSGTIFFGLCNLRCVFCQNWDISQQRAGHGVRARGDRGAHARPAGAGLPQRQLRDARARRAAGDRGHRGSRARGACGCRSSTTPAPTTRSRRCGCSTGWWTSTCPTSSSGAPRPPPLAKARDYPERAREAILEMHRQVGPLQVRARRAGQARRAGAAPRDARPGRRGRGDLRVARARGLCPTPTSTSWASTGPSTRSARSPDGGRRSYAEIDRRPAPAEMEAAYAAARRAGLWRFDERRLDTE